MKVWRIEDADGVGLYRKLVAPYDPVMDLRIPSAANMAIEDDWTPFDNDCNPQTPPREDAKLMQQLGSREFDDYLFGFSTPQQMRSWFYKDSWLRKLHEFGMTVAIYWVEDGLVVGDTQALIPKSSELLERTPIGPYFGLK